MSRHHHRDRSWAPRPQPLPQDSHVVDDHTHVASVVPFSREMSRQALERGQDPVEVLGIDQQLDLARSVGVEGIIDVGCEYPNLRTAVDMALSHPGVVHAAVAIHPNEAVLHGHHGVPGPDGLPISYKPWHDLTFSEAFEEVRRLCVENPGVVVAIGETGMDLFRTGAAAEQIQREAFREHIALAKELDLPMQIHDRDAHAQVVETLLADGSPEFTVFHSYSGDADMGRIAREQGWYLSLSGTVGYKGNEGIRESARIVGLDHVMVETDAPYLAPMPYRGRPNAPYMIPYTLAALTEVFDLPVADVARATRRNVRTVYGF
ncbi:TatD family hydrolase [uncultured Bifidobacterium sp.]|uniref:TatD family hydrolase n=1 Tax=uncultured Bifidobacterium sp. TaxID=165187 RepID=UPI0026031626|nr:TatD family hydrolase [uncultured Bifidobacterium sp.]